MADISAISLFFCAVHHLKKSRLKRFILYSALALLFHKVMWFFVPPVTIWGIFTFRKSRFLFILTYFPLLLWIVAGAFYHGEFFWFMNNSYEFLFATKKTSFLFDGIIASLFSSSPSKIIKGVILLSITLFTAFSFYTSIRHRRWISAGICISLLVISATVNYFEAWIIARYSKLLIIPIICFCAHLPQVKGIRILQCAIILVFLFSNLLFGYYMAKIFYT